MVWQAPDETDRRKRDLLRAAILWGLFALLFLAAVAVVHAGGRGLALSPPVTAGPLSAPVPQGWRVTADAAGPRITALAPEPESAAGGSSSLAVYLAPDRGDYGPRGYLGRSVGTAANAARPVEVAGGDGLMIELSRSLGNDTSEVARVLAAGQGPPGRVVVIELLRFGEGDAAAESALVRRVAVAVRVAGP